VFKIARNMAMWRLLDRFREITVENLGKIWFTSRIENGGPDMG
jgi:hypothetical protein